MSRLPNNGLADLTKARESTRQSCAPNAVKLMLGMPDLQHLKRTTVHDSPCRRAWGLRFLTKREFAKYAMAQSAHSWQLSSNEVTESPVKTAPV